MRRIPRHSPYQKFVSSMLTLESMRVNDAQFTDVDEASAGYFVAEDYLVA